MSDTALATKIRTCNAMLDSALDYYTRQAVAEDKARFITEAKRRVSERKATR